MEKRTNKEIAELVEREGLGYVVQHYLATHEIQDKKLAALWQEASDLLDEISDILEEAAEEEDGCEDDAG